MSQVTITMAPYESFAAVNDALAYLGESIPVPTDPKQGIHIVGIIDDGICIQHACAVVIGDFTDSWELLGDRVINSPLGRDLKIVIVAFKQGSIPVLVGEKDTCGDVDMHSLYSPRCHCIRITK